MDEEKNANEQEFNFEKVSQQDLFNLTILMCRYVYLYPRETYGGTDGKCFQKRLSLVSEDFLIGNFGCVPCQRRSMLAVVNCSV